MLARAIELHGDPCLLVLDEVGLLPPGTVESIELLLKRSPGNLHVAMAFRSNPGLDLAAHFLDGSGIILRAPLFRFSRPEIARFFDDALSRRELATVEERTAGWPVALMVDRNMRAAGAEQPDVDPAELSENYVGVRLLRGLSRQDREGEDAEALAFDRVLTQAVLAGGTCRFLHGALDHLRPAAGATACVGERARFRSSAWHLLRCISCCHRAEFEVEPPARRTGAGLFRRRHALWGRLCQHIPRDGGHGAGARAGSRRVVQARPAGYAGFLPLRSPSGHEQ